MYKHMILQQYFEMMDTEQPEHLRDICIPRTADQDLYEDLNAISQELPEDGDKAAPSIAKSPASVNFVNDDGGDGPLTLRRSTVCAEQSLQLYQEGLIPGLERRDSTLLDLIQSKSSTEDRAERRDLGSDSASERETSSPGGKQVLFVDNGGGRGPLTPRRPTVCAGLAGEPTVETTNDDVAHATNCDVDGDNANEDAAQDLGYLNSKALEMAAGQQRLSVDHEAGERRCSSMSSVSFKEGVEEGHGYTRRVSTPPPPRTSQLHTPEEAGTSCVPAASMPSVPYWSDSCKGSLGSVAHGLTPAGIKTVTTQTPPVSKPSPESALLQEEESNDRQLLLAKESIERNVMQLGILKHISILNEQGSEALNALNAKNATEKRKRDEGHRDNAAIGIQCAQRQHRARKQHAQKQQQMLHLKTVVFAEDNARFELMEEETQHREILGLHAAQNPQPPGSAPSSAKISDNYEADFEAFDEEEPSSWESDSAIKIQTAYRRYGAQCRVEGMRQAKHEKESALKIQTSFRKHGAQRRVEELRRARHTQDALRLEEGIRRAQQENDSATKIQTSFRKHVAHRKVQGMHKVKKEHGSATKIQCAYRQRASKRTVDDMRRARDADDAAVTIQCMYRSRCARRVVRDMRQQHQAIQQELTRQMQEDESATKIQATFRKHGAQRTLEDLRKAKQDEQRDSRERLPGLPVEDPPVQGVDTKRQTRRKNIYERIRLEEEEETARRLLPPRLYVELGNLAWCKDLEVVHRWFVMSWEKKEREEVLRNYGPDFHKIKLVARAYYIRNYETPAIHYLNDCATKIQAAWRGMHARQRAREMLRQQELEDIKYNEMLSQVTEIFKEKLTGSPLSHNGRREVMLWYEALPKHVQDKIALEEVMDTDSERSGNIKVDFLAWGCERSGSFGTSATTGVPPRYSAIPSPPPRPSSALVTIMSPKPPPHPHRATRAAQDALSTKNASSPGAQRAAHAHGQGMQPPSSAPLPNEGSWYVYDKDPYQRPGQAVQYGGALSAGGQYRPHAPPAYAQGMIVGTYHQRPGVAPEMTRQPNQKSDVIHDGRGVLPGYRDPYYTLCANTLPMYYAAQDPRALRHMHPGQHIPQAPHSMCHRPVPPVASVPAHEPGGAWA
jgi:hypothetical protein